MLQKKQYIKKNLQTKYKYTHADNACHNIIITPEENMYFIDHS